ncbi:MAG: short-chain dehydrogenase, partial [Planctomycetota bacterium]
MSTYLITGVNRGIGLELGRQLAERREVVLGTARDPSAATQAFEAGIEVLEVDVADGSSVASLA